MEHMTCNQNGKGQYSDCNIQKQLINTA